MIGSQYQEAYNALYAGETIRLEFDYKELAVRYLTGVRVFKLRQDEHLRKLGFLDKELSLGSSIKEEGDKYYLILNLIPKKPNWMPKFTIVEQAPSEEMELLTHGQ